jgi:acetyltransferase-like isoleucine patch superfamily enzyme
MTSLATRVRLKTIQAYDRFRLRRLRDRHPGFQLHPDASTNFASSHFELAPGAQLVIGPRVYTERRARGVHFSIAEGASVEIGADTWLRPDAAPVLIFAYPGARIRIGNEGFLNGCHLSAKKLVDCGNRVWIGMGSRVFDSNQHDLDADRREEAKAVRIGDHCWIAADVTVLKGVEIGEQTVVGTRSLVTHSLPPHTLAHGNPATPQGKIGDRSKVPI